MKNDDEGLSFKGENELSAQFRPIIENCFNIIYHNLCSELETKIKEIKDLVLRENKLLKGEIECLKEKVDAQEQYSKRLNVLLMGVSESQNENLEMVVKDVATKAKMRDFNISSTQRIHRIGQRGARQRPILIRFVSQRDKVYFFKSIINFNKINQGNFISIREHLTAIRKSIFDRAFHLKRDKKITSVSTIDGQIVIKYNGHFHHVSTFKQLDEFVLKNSL